MLTRRRFFVAPRLDQLGADETTHGIAKIDAVGVQ